MDEKPTVGNVKQPEMINLIEILKREVDINSELINRVFNNVAVIRPIPEANKAEQAELCTPPTEGLMAALWGQAKTVNANNIELRRIVEQLQNLVG